MEDFLEETASTPGFYGLGAEGGEPGCDGRGPCKLQGLELGWPAVRKRQPLAEHSSRVVPAPLLPAWDPSQAKHQVCRGWGSSFCLGPTLPTFLRDPCTVPFPLPAHPPRGGCRAWLSKPCSSQGTPPPPSCQGSHPWGHPAPQLRPHQPGCSPLPSTQCLGRGGGGGGKEGEAPHCPALSYSVQRGRETGAQGLPILASP